jgi:hypothetical protein
LVPDVINRVRNADFSQGRSKPSGWVFNAKTKRARWHRDSAATVEEASGVTIECDKARGTALFSQVVICRPGEFYRVEATVTCELDAPDESSGLVIEVQPFKDDRPVGQRMVTPGLRRASDAVAVRAYYQAPEGIRRVRLSVGVTGARGSASVQHVRFIRVLEPEEESHILAIPQPPYTMQPPKAARSVCVCSEQAESRPLTGLLSGYLGEQHVQAIRPGELSPSNLRSDALLLPDATPPPAVQSLHTLLGLASDRIVVLSLPAFARLSNGMLSLKRIEQDDDPIHAKVVYTNHATHGFALHDVFAYAWPGQAMGSFVQNQYRKTEAFKSFRAKHGLEILLDSVCDKDATTDRPVCLYKPTKGGGLFVLDIEPVEAASSTRGEPALAMHLLLSVLGHTQVSLGQYMVPESNEVDFRGHIRDMTERFERFVVHEEDVPVDEATTQLVTLDAPPSPHGTRGKKGTPLTDFARMHTTDQSPERKQRVGVPRAWGSDAPRPAILVRTGLTAGDVESAYGAWIWFKQFVRAEPFACPYASELGTQFRLAWIPLVAPWEAAYGWRRSGRRPSHPMKIEIDDAEIAAMIDIVACPVNRVRVVLPSESGDYPRYAAWLPRLTEAFPPGRYFRPTVSEGEAFCDRDRVAWRHVRHEVSIAVDEAVFDDPAHRDVLAAGGQAIRLEVPGNDAGFVARSIQHTDLVATLLEHVIGLQYGLLAVNRGPSPVQLDALPPVDPGEVLIVHQTDPLLRADASQTG